MTTKDTKLRKRQQLRNNEYYDFQDTLDKLYEKSQKGCNFTDLLSLIISEQNILLAYRNIKKNKGSKTKGTNNSTIIDIGASNPHKVVEYVRNRLIDFKPHSIRRVEVKKDNGKIRPLGVPTIEDRLIQQCIKQILEPICEAKFHNHSYGFRPNRSTHHAVSRVAVLINISKLHYAVDIDIKGFFDNINHAKLLKQLWTIGVRDKKLLCVLSKMLKAKIEGIGISEKGVIQGGIISPLLANVVLNELDWWVSNQWETFKTQKEYTQNGHRISALKKTELKEVYIVRYADDFKLMCRTKTVASKMFIATTNWLKERLNLDISEEKSKIVNLKRQYSEFLGIKLKVYKKASKWVYTSHMSDKSVKKCREKLEKSILQIQDAPNIESVLNFNATVLGMHNYYSMATNISRNFADISFSLKKCLYNRTHKFSSQKGSKGKCFLKYYKRYSGKVVYMCKTALFPISHIKFKIPFGFTQKKCNYTQGGRALLHDNLRDVSLETLLYLMKNPVKQATVEFNDNRISLYAGQQGKCFVTNTELQVGDIETHHIKPKHMKGSDEYKNLCLVTTSIHRLIHATLPETITKYLSLYKFTKDDLTKLNKLRVSVGNCEITENK